MRMTHDSACRRTRRRLALAALHVYACVAALGLAATGTVAASDWPRFRGPNGTGVSTDRDLPTRLDPARNALWSVRTPEGNSSPIVVGGRLLLTAHAGDERILLCYEARSGAELWRRSVVRMRQETFNALNGPTTPTPATDGRHVFVFFPEVGLVSYDWEGTESWRTPLGPFRSVQGLAASPIHVNGKVALLIDTPEEAYLSAFDALTGKLSWRTERPTGVLGSYATPTLWVRCSEPTQIIVAGATQLTGYHAGTGSRLWWADRVTVFPTAPPFVAGDAVYTVEPRSSESGWPPFRDVLDQFDPEKDGQVALADASKDTTWARSLIGIDRNLGDGNGIVTREEYAKASRGSDGGGLARTRLGGEGDVSATHVVWRHEKGMPSLAGALLYQEVLYVVRKAVVTALDPQTGEVLRRGRIRAALGDYYASPVAGDGKIYLASRNGKITVLRAGVDWETLSTVDLGEQVIATPAIADGRLYVRTEKTLYCFGNASGSGTREQR